MSLNNVPSGKNLPDDFNVIIEIPMHGEPVKYEVDKESGAIFVDRFMNTLCGDGDPVDVLVVTPVPLQTGVVVRCRPLGVLKMEDEGGQDAKLIAVPVDKLSTLYRGMQSHTDLPEITLKQISHFFAHYKDLEPNKWVKIDGWYGVEEARAEIMDSVANYQNASDKPAF
jgi:inorganic pyrophosphatase